LDFDSIGEVVSDEITKDSLQPARLEEQFNTIRRDVEQMAEQMAAQQTQLSEILAKLNEARGGWKMLMLIGGSCASVGATISWMLQHVRVTP
jgi:hypothetical protein